MLLGCWVSKLCLEQFLALPPVKADNNPLTVYTHNRYGLQIAKLTAIPDEHIIQACVQEGMLRLYQQAQLKTAPDIILTPNNQAT